MSTMSKARLFILAAALVGALALPSGALARNNDISWGTTTSTDMWSSGSETYYDYHLCQTTGWCGGTGSGGGSGVTLPGTSSNNGGGGSGSGGTQPKPKPPVVVTPPNKPSTITVTTENGVIVIRGGDGKSRISEQKVRVPKP